jgi:hypothetical protein
MSPNSRLKRIEEKLNSRRQELLERDDFSLEHILRF